MKKLLTICFALGMLTSMNLVAQDAMKQDSMKADTAAKSVSLTGKISDDGKTFVNDADSKSWTISNPDAVKGHEGHHVVVKGKVDADKGEVNVVSLKMAS
jgi:hypothetical protein